MTTTTDREILIPIDPDTKAIAGAMGALGRALRGLGTLTLDEITRKLSAFGSFAELLDTHPNYRPTIFDLSPEHHRLKMSYDLAMLNRGDARRSYPPLAPAVGDRVSLYRMNAQRSARVDGVGPKFVKVSYVTKTDRKWTEKRRARGETVEIPRRTTRVSRAAFRLNYGGTWSA